MAFPGFGGTSKPPEEDSGPQGPQAPCVACGEPTKHAGDVDRNDGRGFVRTPVCDVGCLNELMEQFGGRAGSQVRSRYPSAADY